MALSFDKGNRSSWSNWFIDFKSAFQLNSNGFLKVDFLGSRVTSDNDAERLSVDLTFRLIGSQKIWDRGAALAPTLHGFEGTADRRFSGPEPGGAVSQDTPQPGRSTN